MNFGGDKFSPSPLNGFLANIVLEYCYENDQTYKFSNIIVKFLIGCHKICKTCFGPDKTHCLSCNDNILKVLKNNECLCLRNYYEDENNVC